MSKSRSEMAGGANLPTAPDSSAAFANFEYDNAMRAPPPTYEESQRRIYAPPQNAAAPGYPPPSMATYLPAPMPGYQSAAAGYPPVAANQYYGMTYHQQLPTHMPMQPYNYNTGLVGPSTSAGLAASHVLMLDSRASVRTNNAGAVVIPPPPPGCLPTPAQLAAMQGKQVVVQQKKRSFF